MLAHHSVVLFAFLMLTTSALAQVAPAPVIDGEDRIGRSHACDLIHVRSDLRFDEVAETARGTVTNTLAPIGDGVDRVELDADGLAIESVMLGDHKLAFTESGGKLRIELGEPHAAGEQLPIAVTYSVHKPGKGLYFVNPTAEDPTKPVQIWTQGEDED